MIGARRYSTYRESTGRIAETCPKVDEAAAEIEGELHTAVSKSLADFVSYVKDSATIPLREALCEALDERDQMQTERDDALEVVRKLENEVESLRDEVASLAADLNDAREAQYA